MCKVDIDPQLARTIAQSTSADPVQVRGVFRDWLKPGVIIGLVTGLFTAGAAWAVIQFQVQLHIDDEQVHQPISVKEEQHQRWHAPLDRQRKEFENAQRDWYTSEIAKLQIALEKMRERQVKFETQLAALQERSAQRQR